MMFRAAALALAAATALPAAAQDRPPFPPQTPFRAEAAMPQDVTGEVIYSGERARVAMKTPAGPVTSYVDWPGRKVVMALDMQGMRMGMEVELDSVGLPDPEDAEAERLGSDTIAGEDCTVWRMTAKEADGPAEICVTDDGIPLRAMVTHEGKQTRAFEVTRLERGPQEEAGLRPPAGLAVMKLDMGSLGALGGLGGLPIPGMGR